MISGIWYTTQSKNITSPPNNDNLPSLSMHKVSGSRDGVDVDVEDDEDGDGLMESLPPTPRRSRW
jgi:hypothetical protein